MVRSGLYNNRMFFNSKIIMKRFFVLFIVLGMFFSIASAQLNEAQLKRQINALDKVYQDAQL